MVPIAVLASGSGTNLEALLAADLGPGRIARVIVNVPGAGAVAAAEAAGVPVTVLDHKVHRPRDVFEARAVEVLRSDGIAWVVFAGFMRVVGPTFLAAFGGRTVNIHPSLLPAFPGIDAQRQAFEAGVRMAGCTVHLVDDGVDTGPILAQTAVPVRDGDDAESLRLRILAAEHELLPRVVRALAEGRLDRSGARPRLVGCEGPDGRLSSISEGAAA